MTILTHFYEYNESLDYKEDDPMLKYVLAWLLGVPLGVLLIIYLISHAF